MGTGGGDRGCVGGMDVGEGSQDDPVAEGIELGEGRE